MNFVSFDRTPYSQVCNEISQETTAYIVVLTLWPWSWTFTVQHTIYVKCEYFMNQEE